MDFFFQKGKTQGIFNFTVQDLIKESSPFKSTLFKPVIILCSGFRSIFSFTEVIFDFAGKLS